MQPNKGLSMLLFPDCGIDAHSWPPFKVWKQHMVVIKCANAEPCDNHCKLSSSDFSNGTVTYTAQMNWWPYSSNLRMVRPSSMSVVKLLIIRVHEASSKILDLASYLVVRWCSHCTPPLNWELPLLCYPTLQWTSSLIFMPKIKKRNVNKHCYLVIYVTGGQRQVRIAPLEVKSGWG